LPAPPKPTAAPQEEPTPPLPTGISVVSTILIVFGIAAVLFAGFALWGSHVIQEREQDRLRAELAERFVIDRASADTGAEAEGAVVAGSEFGGEPAEGEAGAEGEESEQGGPEELGEAGPGDPIAVLRIPEVGVDQVVVNGTTTEQLRRGPGHLRGTSLPGQKGNVVIAGKRATYGAPFADIDKLRKGDEIELSSSSGTYVYEVEDVEVAKPGEDEDFTAPAEANQLTLFSAEPRYQGGRQLVVVAKFTGDDEAPPLIAVPPGFEPRTDELGLGRDPTAWASVMLFLVLIALTVAGLVWARRRWTPWAVWAIGAPILLGLGVLLYENLLRWFPSTV
jgi:sortase A